MTKEEVLQDLFAGGQIDARTQWLTSPTRAYPVPGIIVGELFLRGWIQRVDFPTRVVYVKSHRAPGNTKARRDR